MEKREQRAALALWWVPGIGPKTLRDVREKFDLGEILDTPVSAWAPEIAFTQSVAGKLAKVDCLASLADKCLRRIAKAGYQIAFEGDAAYPSNLLTVKDRPPLLFWKGSLNAPRRRIAMVGTRRSHGAEHSWSKWFAGEVARVAGIISGGAQGVDTVCHLAAVDRHQETWAFLGSSLDEIDPWQSKLGARILEAGGSLYSEFPPGVRASRETFPRRNRLISGASDAVIVMLAGIPSGTLHTVEYAEGQGRPLFAVPGNPRDELSKGCNQLLFEGRARAVSSPEQLFAALNAATARADRPAPVGAVVDVAQLGELARKVYDNVEKTPRPFDDLLLAAQVPSAALAGALTELEIMGLVVQRAGRRYEKV
jgi:DNA processing protein